MDRNTRVIQLDPFFDSGIADPPAVSQQPAVSQPQQGYGAVDPFMLSHMRPSAAGLRGTVIPRATMGGIPFGTRPHVTQDVMVNIDPHIPGQSSVVRLGDLNANTIGAATAAASNLTPEPTDMTTLRLRSAAIMHTLAGQLNANHFESRPAPVAAVPQPTSWGDQQLAVPQSQNTQPRSQERRRVSPLAAFNQPSTQPTVRDLRDIQLRDEPPTPRVGPPTVRVIFEMEHFGTLPVNYHDVIIESGFIVLVFDNRHQGSTKYFPSTQKAAAPRMALTIAGTDDVYLVETTGIQFESESKEFCVLLISETGTITEQGDA